MANTTKKQKKQPMGRESKIALLVLLIAVVVVLGVRMWRAGDAEQSVADLAAALEAAIPAQGSTVEIDGHSCAALLEPISLEIKLPVLTAYSDEAIRTAPAIYAGTVGQPGLVIGGGSSAAQFGLLTELFYGDLVWLTATDGTVYEYEMDDLVLQNTADPAKLDTGDWDLALFTQHKKGEYMVAGFYLTGN